jgi:hypothetical protein
MVIDKNEFKIPLRPSFDCSVRIHPSLNARYHLHELAILLPLFGKDFMNPGVC